jgi:hypothetical protein
MDKNENRLSPGQEFHVPDGAAEYSLPKPETEFYTARREKRSEGEAGKKPSRVRRLIRYTAAAVVSLSLLAETAPPPAPEKEIVDIESNITITCAAVRPEEPGLLYYHDYGGAPEYTMVRIRCFLVDAQGQETELDVGRPARSYTRHAYCPEAVFRTDQAAYKMFGNYEDAAPYLNDPDWIGYGNLSVHYSAAQLPENWEGGTLKVCHYYDGGDVLLRMTATREITPLPPDGTCSAELRAEPIGDGHSEASFEAVYRPQPGDRHVYDFWTESLCTRWYDAAGAFLGEGWMNAAVKSWDGLARNFERRGDGSYVYSYAGTIQSDAEDPAAAFYSMELHVIDDTTGWHYLFESNQLPVTE